MYLIKYDGKYFLLNDDKNIKVNDIIYINGVITNATIYHVYNRHTLQFKKVIASELKELNLDLINTDNIENAIRNDLNIFFPYKDIENLIEFYSKNLKSLDFHKITEEDKLIIIEKLKTTAISNILINVDNLFENNNGTYEIKK